MVQELDAMNGKIKEKCEELEKLAFAVEGLQANLDAYRVVEEKLMENIRNTEQVIQQLDQTKH